jgi:hypothetical protein
MKYSIVLLFVAILKLVSSSRLRNQYGYYYVDENNKIVNYAGSNAHGVAVNYGYKGFAQANPTAVSSNSNVIY